jgi:hypothetical protein
MSDDHANPPSRRRVLQALLLAAAAPAFLQAPRARAAGLTPLPATNPQAKALGYVADAAAARNPAHKPGSACANCQFFQAATSGCAIFVGFSVAPKGWCSAWAKKA